MFAGHFASYLLRRNLQHIILHVTSRCNFRCRHCFVDFSNPQDLSLEDCVALSKQVRGLFWLDIGGGEPFLRKDLPAIVEAFDARVVMIPSNGSLPDVAAEQARDMKERTGAEIGVSLSLEGLKDTNDRMRQKGSWDGVWNTFERLREVEGISVKINTVLSNENAGEVLDLMQEVQKRGPDFHSVILLRGQPRDLSVALPPLEELKRLVPQILKIQGTYGYGRNPVSARILRNYHRYMWELSLRAIEHKAQPIPCLGGRAHLVVLPDGSVSSCEMLPTVGNIRKQSLGEISGSLCFKEQLGSIRDRECWCTHNCAMLDSVLFNPASIPRLVSPW